MMIPRIARREFLVAMGAAAILPACSREEFSADMIAKASSDLPFEIFKVPGEHAVRAWEELSQKFSGAASAVVLGPEEELEYLDDGMMRDGFGSPDSILAKANTIKFPSDFRYDLKAQTAKMLEQFKGDPVWKSLFEDSGEVKLAEDMPIGDWPNEAVDPAKELGLSVVRNWDTGRPHDEVFIALFPTADWTEIPAYLPFGGWNACPMPEWHVAALRYWRETHGARLIGLHHDEMDLRIQTRPASRDEAIILAREQYDYCSDIVDQGVGSLAALAHELMASDWWSFWWD